MCISNNYFFTVHVAVIFMLSVWRNLLKVNVNTQMILCPKVAQWPVKEKKGGGRRKECRQNTTNHTKHSKIYHNK